MNNLIILEKHLKQIKVLSKEEQSLLLNSLIDYLETREVKRYTDNKFFQIFIEELIFVIDNNTDKYKKKQEKNKEYYNNKQQPEKNKFLNPLKPTPKQIRDPLKNPQPFNNDLEVIQEQVELEQEEVEKPTVDYKNLTQEEREEIKEAREKQKLKNYEPKTIKLDKSLQDLVEKVNTT